MISPSYQGAFQLANTYLVTGNLPRARKLFNELYAKNPPEEMKLAIATQLELINRLERSPSSAIATLGKKSGHSLHGYLLTGFTWDSNPRLSPSSRYIDSAIGQLELNSNYAEKADFMTYEQVALNYAYNFENSPWAIKSSLFGHTGFYSTIKELDHQFYSMRLGLAYETNRFGLGVHGIAQSLYQDYDDALSILGGEVSGHFAINPNMILYGTWQCTEKEYYNSYSEHAHNNRLTLGLATQLQDMHVVNVSAGYELEDATHRLNSYQRFFGTVRYEARLPHKFTPYVYGRIQNTDYQDEDWLFADTRNDNEYELGIGVRKVLWEDLEGGLAFDVDCRYAYTDRHSTIDMYDCVRNTLSMQFRFLF
ncbi:MAG: surface lipoprotein assembly modifier [Pseudomonadota bacterium]